MVRRLANAGVAVIGVGVVSVAIVVSVVDGAEPIDGANRHTRVSLGRPTDAGSPRTSSALAQSAPSSPMTSTSAVADEVVVTDAASLDRALLDAHPGSTITLADGNYHGKDVNSTFALFQGPRHLITESENERRDLAP